MINLMKGDCLERMKEIPDGSVDLILTDPPYNIAKPNNFHTMGRTGIDFGEWDKGFDLFSYIDGLSRVCTKNANVVIFNDWKNIGEIAKYAETKGFVIKDMLRWEKSNPMPRNRDRRFVVDYEVAVWLTMPKAKWVFNRQSDTYDRPCFKGSLTPSSEKTEHTTQKPVWLMENILKTLSDEGDTVLDLFMGSGTTGVASVNTNRSFVGIELDENYFNIAEKRIQETINKRNKNMSRCVCCNLRLESFDDLLYCKRCIKASEDTTTDWKDPQLKLITDVKQGCVITQMRGNRE